MQSSGSKHLVLTLILSASVFPAYSYAIETQSTFDSVVSYIDEVATSLKNYFNDNKDDIADNTRKFGKKAGELTSDAAEGVSKFANNHKDDVVKLASKTGKAIGNVADDTSSAVGEFAKKHKGDIREFAESTGKKASSLANSAAEALSD